MQRFRFSPRHPIARLGFTPDGSGVVTAQPHTSVAVRDRSSGELRVAYPANGAAKFSQFHVHPTIDLITVQCPKWCRVFNPNDLSKPYLFTEPAWHAGAIPITNGFRLCRAFPTVGPIYLTTGDVTLDSPETPWANRRVRLRTAELALVTPDGRFGLAVRQTTRPVLFDLNSGRVPVEVQSRLRIQNVKLGNAVFACSPDGSKLAIGNGDSLAVFDLSRVPTDEPPTPDDDDEGTKKKKVLSPLFTIDRPDAEAGRGTHADRTAERWLPPLAFDPTGQTLLTVGLRNRVQRIDVATGAVIVEWGWRADIVRSLAVSPDGLTAAAGCRLGELIVWDLE